MRAPSGLSLAIRDLSEDVLEHSGLSTVTWKVEGVSHQEVRSALARFSMGDLVLGPGQALTPDMSKVRGSRDFPEATTDLPPAGVTIGAFSVGGDAPYSWESSVNVALWYTLQEKFKIGQVVTLGTHPPFRPPKFVSAIAMPNMNHPRDTPIRHERLSCEPKNDAQAFKFLELIRSYQGRV